MLTVVIGTRAQLIKMAPVLRELEARNLDYKLVFTGQHVETMAELYQDFGIKTPYEQWHKGKEIDGIARMTVWFFSILAKFIVNRRKLGVDLRSGPENIIVVHGDTVSTLLGALLGRITGIQVAHVESGLRSFKIFHPFPEELIRLLVFRLCDIAFCPNAWAINNLNKYDLKKINTNSNTIIDAVRYAIAKSNEGQTIDEPYAVVSIHRFENVYSKSRLITVIELMLKIPDGIDIVFVLHPVTEKKLKKHGYYEDLRIHPRVTLMPRMSYTRFINLAYASEFVITDGGSNQEELSYMGVPVLLLRRATERIEGLGEHVFLSDYDTQKIEKFFSEYRNLERKKLYQQYDSPAKLIVEELTKYSG